MKIIVQTSMLFILINCCGIFCHAQPVTVMTYNIHHGANKEEVDQIEAMGAYIKHSGADLIGLQEVDSVCKRSGGIDQMKRLGEITGMHYAFVRHFPYQDGAYGMGILSRYPVKNVTNNRLPLLQKDSLRNSTALISADIKLSSKKTICFASAHFALDEATRLVQASETIKTLSTSKYPVIFTGDLNAIPDTKELQLLNTFFTPTDTTSIPTFPNDKAVKTIDYIFVNTKHRGRVILQNFQVPAVNYSDHLPAIAKIDFSAWR
jgi:endonuclease/exonuclease/phosphatase family metal-dependent hydrolase